jgi:NAD(P)-dependent dehydrogenase (short-subunit alcohol dehydrogenase family)
MIGSWFGSRTIFGSAKPEDLGTLVAFIASPRAEFMTGTAITIDSGAIRQY